MPERVSRIRAQMGADLRRLRTLAGMTQRRMEGLTEIGQVAVSRIERGEQLPSLPQAEAWLSATKAQAEDRDRVLALVEAAHGETRPWSELSDSSHLQGIAQDREDAAVLIRDCALTWVPGLCQTAEYARLITPQVDPEGSIDHAASVAARIERQQILYRTGRRFEFLVAEQALLWAPGPGVMAGQRDKLATIATLSDAEVRVLPSRRESNPLWHNFTLYTDATGDVAAATEFIHGGGFAQEPKTTQLYDTVWDGLWSASVAGDEAVEMIRRAA